MPVPDEPLEFILEIAYRIDQTLSVLAIQLELLQSDTDEAKIAALAQADNVLAELINIHTAVKEYAGEQKFTESQRKQILDAGHWWTDFENRVGGGEMHSNEALSIWLKYDPEVFIQDIKYGFGNIIDWLDSLIRIVKGEVSIPEESKRQWLSLANTHIPAEIGNIASTLSNYVKQKKTCQ